MRDPILSGLLSDGELPQHGGEVARQPKVFLPPTKRRAHTGVQEEIKRGKKSTVRQRSRGQLPNDYSIYRERQVNSTTVNYRRKKRRMKRIQENERPNFSPSPIKNTCAWRFEQSFGGRGGPFTVSNKRSRQNLDRQGIFTRSRKSANSPRNSP